jgi:hypothetical protein
MDFSYINLLYKEFNQKRDNIKAYCEAANDRAGSIYQSVYEAVSYLQKKHEALNSAEVVKRLPSTSELAVEAKDKKVDGSVSSESLKDLDASISMSYSEINFLFQKEQKVLQNLVVAAQEFQEIVNNISTAWEQIIEQDATPQ